MYKTVFDLNRDELDELKESYFYNDETKDINENEFIFPSEIPDDIIFNYYDGVMFVDEDFWCNLQSD